MTEIAREEPRTVPCFPCQRCGSVAAMQGREDLQQWAGGGVLCDGCLRYKMVLAQDVMQVLERDGGFTPERREALMHLTELVVNDPEKALRYQKLEHEVEGLRREVGFLKWSLPALLAAFALIVAVVALAT